MTVAELIEKLKTFPQDMKVAVFEPELACMVTFEEDEVNIVKSHVDDMAYEDPPYDVVAIGMGTDYEEYDG